MRLFVGIFSADGSRRAEAFAERRQARGRAARHRARGERAQPAAACGLRACWRSAASATWRSWCAGQVRAAPEAYWQAGRGRTIYRARFLARAGAARHRRRAVAALRRARAAARRHRTSDPGGQLCAGLQRAGHAGGRGVHDARAGRARRATVPPAPTRPTRRALQVEQGSAGLPVGVQVAAPALARRRGAGGHGRAGSGASGPQTATPTDRRWRTDLWGCCELPERWLSRYASHSAVPSLS